MAMREITIMDLQDTRDKVIRLEAVVDQMQRNILAMDAKLDQMHNILEQAKGARWVLFALVGLGGFLAAKVPAIMALFGVK